MLERSQFLESFLLAAVVIMALTGHVVVLAVGLVILVLHVGRSRPAAFYRVGRPRTWLISLVVFATLGMLLGKSPVWWHGVPVSFAGLEAGIAMTLRAFTLVLVMVVISARLSRDRFLGFTARFGLDHYAPAFADALSTVPHFRQALGRRGEQEDEDERLSLKAGFVNLLLVADNLARAELIPQVVVFGITGRRSQGKTTLLTAIANQVRASGLVVGGVLQERSQVADHEILEAVSVADGSRIPMARREAGKLFEIDSDAFVNTGRWIAESAGVSQLMVVDEMGLLEAKGVGHTPAVRSAMMAYPNSVWVLTLRKDKADLLGKLWGISPERYIDLDQEDVDREKFAQSVIEALTSDSKASEPDGT